MRCRENVSGLAVLALEVGHRRDRRGRLGGQGRDHARTPHHHLGVQTTDGPITGEHGKAGHNCQFRGIGAVKWVRFHAATQHPHQIVGLSSDRLQRHRLPPVLERLPDVFGKLSGPASDRRIDLRLFAGRGDLFFAELPDGLEHAITNPAVLHHVQQGLIHKRIENVVELETACSHQFRGRFPRETTREPAQPTQSDLRRAVEQFPAPLDHRMQGAMSHWRRAATRTQQRKAVGQSLGDLADGHRPDPGGGQFDCQRQTVQRPAERRDLTEVDRHIRADRMRAGDEQIRCCRALLADIEGRELMDDLTADPQRRSAGRQDPYPVCRRDQLARDARRGIDDVLTVVEDDQGVRGQGVGEPRTQV